MGSPPASPGKIKEVLERVDNAAAKVKALDAQVRAELDEEKRQEGQKKRRHPKTEAQMMSRGAVERERAHALAAWLEREEDDDDEDDDEEEDDDEPEPNAKKPKRAPKKDLLAMYGSHEKVLTHYMQLSNGFVVEDHGASGVQLVVPKCGVEKMKSFRARFGRHLRALGFVPNTPEEAEKQSRLLKPEYLECAEKFDSNVWVRPYAIEPNRAFAQRKLDPHTLLEEKPPDAIDPALLEDPLADA